MHQNCLTELFVISTVLKNKNWMYKIKNSNGVKTRRFLWKRIVVKEIIIEPDSHITDRFHGVWDLSHYATKNIKTLLQKSYIQFSC